MFVSNYYVPNKNNKLKWRQNNEDEKVDQKWETLENVLGEYLIQIYEIADSPKQNSNYIKLLEILKVDDLTWKVFLGKQINSINDNLKDKEEI